MKMMTIVMVFGATCQTGAIIVILTSIIVAVVTAHQTLRFCCQQENSFTCSDTDQAVKGLNSCMFVRNTSAGMTKMMTTAAVEMELILMMLVAVKTTDYIIVTTGGDKINQSYEALYKPVLLANNMSPYITIVI